MAYDEELDDRVANIALSWDATCKKMFGGTCYLLHGNMMAGVLGSRLILRLGAPAADAALTQPFVYPFDFTGRPMQGWIMVGPERLGDPELADWLAQARAFVESLPAKS